jgi:hypothetical protein
MDHTAIQKVWTKCTKLRGAFTTKPCKNAPVSFLCVSICLSACNISRIADWILMTFVNYRDLTADVIKCQIKW